MLTGLEVFLTAVSAILFGLAACAGACARALGREVGAMWAELGLAESEGRLNERDRCLGIVENLKAMCPSESAVLDRAAEHIREGT